MVQGCIAVKLTPIRDLKQLVGLKPGTLLLLGNIEMSFVIIFPLTSFQFHSYFGGICVFGHSLLSSYHFKDKPPFSQEFRRFFIYQCVNLYKIEQDD